MSCTLEEFKTMSLLSKWHYISTEMHNISSMDFVVSMRARMNPHHPKEDTEQEKRAARLDQYTRWVAIKDLYVEFRDELANTLDTQDFSECKSILERILTKDFDDELRKAIDQ